MTPSLISNVGTKRQHNAHVIVTSDTCSLDQTRDLSGKYVVDRLKSFNLFGNVGKSYVSDDRAAITACLKKVLIEYNPVLVITVGGTGFCPRDVTPEATSSLYDKNCSGIVAALHLASLKSTPYAALSRLTAGLIDECLVINFPGGEKACKDCLDCIESFIEHAIEQVRFDLQSISDTHQNMQNRTDHTGPNKPSKVSNTKVNSKKPHQNKSSYQQNLNQHCSPQVVSTSTKFTSSPDKSRNVVDQILKRNIATSMMASNSSRNSNMPSTSSTVKCEAPMSSSARHDHSTYQRKFRPYISKSSDNFKPAAPENKESRRTPPRESPYPMIDYDDALNILKNHSAQLINTHSLHKFEMTTQSTGNRALYHVLAEDLRPKVSVPPYPVSTVDGYVISLPRSMMQFVAQSDKIYAELLKDVYEMDRLCFNTRDAGNKFYCYEVSTGGRLPNCEFFIIPREKVDPLQRDRVVLREVKSLLFNSRNYVRETGSDLNARDVIKKGTIIGPVELSLLLSMGHRSLKVWRRPRIGILSTGDELTGAFTPFDEGGQNVVDVNAPLLTTLLGMYKYPAVQFGIARDDPDEITAKMKLAYYTCDVLIVTGGASMGSKDWVKTVIEKQLNGKIHFGRVNIKPGKPVAFATVRRGDKSIPIFSLPGNPVSAYITTLALVLPFLEHGVKHHFEPKFPLDLKLIGDLIQVEVSKIQDEDNSYQFDGRLEFARAKTIGPPSVKSGKFPVAISLKQQSSRLLNLKDFDCLLLVCPNRKGREFSIGDTFWACKLNKII